jgi:hypothetical protein
MRAEPKAAFGPCDLLAKAGSAYEIGCNGWLFSLCDDHEVAIADPDIDRQLEMKPDPAHGAGKVGDVPAQLLV